MVATRTVIVSDGKRGHENQSRVIARMLGDENPIIMYLRDRVRDGGPAELLLRLRLAWFGPQSVRRNQAVELVKKLLKPESAEELRNLAHEIRQQAGDLRIFTVSTGTPPATLNLVMARMLMARAVVNMTPSLLPLRRFDLCVLPAHDLGDKTPEANVVVSPLALGYHDRVAAMHAAGRMIDDYDLMKSGPFWGVAIGGPSKACPWNGDRVLDELAVLHGLARGEDKRLLVTTSRRTPGHCLAWLKKHYFGSEQVAYFLNAAEDPYNPLPAIYELAETMFVTGDSFSMVSEAIHAGLHPVVLRVRVGDAPGKLGRALGMLAEQGLAHLGGGDEEDLAARIPKPPEKRQAENGHYRELRAAVRNRFGLPG